MSFNQLYQDVQKNWCDIRVNNLKIDGSNVGRTETGNITWSGGVVGSSSYEANIIGNVCILKLNQHNPVASAAAAIISTDFPASLVPSGSGLAEFTVMVEDNATRVLGACIINGSGQLQFNIINPANNQPAVFSGSGATGWVRPIILSYTLNQ